MNSDALGALFIERVYGTGAGKLLAGLIVVTAFGSVFALLLGYSRIPCAAASFFSLKEVIMALMAARILVQFIGHTIALILIRRPRPGIERPFKMWFYPVPAVISLAGYGYVFLMLGAWQVIFGVLILLTGVVVYLAAAWRQGEWPFQQEEAA
jgi:amino acid transporter